MSLNMAVIQGPLGADAEVRSMPNGGFVMNLRIATSESWMKDGEKKERTDWHSCTQFFREEPKIARHLTKGKAIIVTGKNRNESYEKDGEKRYKQYIQIERIDFVSGRTDSGNSGNSSSDAAPSSNKQGASKSSGKPAQRASGKSSAQQSLPVDDFVPQIDDSDIPF